MANKAIQVDFLLAGLRHPTTGAVLSSAKVYFYQPGTTTSASVWTDSLQASVASSPIRLDSAGQALVFAEGLYRVKVDDSDDVNIFDWDNLAFIVYADKLRIGEFTGASGKFVQDLFDEDQAVTIRPTVVFFEKGADIASGATLNLGTDGNYFDVTGSTNISAISSLGAGALVKLHFDGALTITHSSSLVCPRSINLSISTGDEVEIFEFSSGKWRVSSITFGASIDVDSFQKGYYRNIQVIGYSSATSALTVKAGMHIEVNGTIYYTSADQILDTDTGAHTDTGSALGHNAAAFIYAHAPASGSAVTAGDGLMLSATGPAYDTAKRGWYHPSTASWRAFSVFPISIFGYLSGVFQNNDEIHWSHQVNIISSGVATSATAADTDPHDYAGNWIMGIHADIAIEGRGAAVAANQVATAVLVQTIDDGAIAKTILQLSHPTAYTPTNDQAINRVLSYMPILNTACTFYVNTTDVMLSVSMRGCRISI